MLPQFALVNMNGRMYDPLLGRMLRPDIIINDMANTQAYNMYSYAFNNPLKFTDPTGWCSEDDDWDDDLGYIDGIDDEYQAPNQSPTPSYNFTANSLNSATPTNSSGEGPNDVTLTIGIWLQNGGPVDDVGNLLDGATSSTVNGVVFPGNGEGSYIFNQAGQYDISNSVAIMLNADGTKTFIDPIIALIRMSAGVSQYAFNMPYSSYGGGDDGPLMASAGGGDGPAKQAIENVDTYHKILDLMGPTMIDAASQVSQAGKDLAMDAEQVLGPIAGKIGPALGVAAIGLVLADVHYNGDDNWQLHNYLDLAMIAVSTAVPVIGAGYIVLSLVTNGAVNQSPTMIIQNFEELGNPNGNMRGAFK